jgi:hypothetical protein
MMAFGAWAAQTNPDGSAGGWGRPIESPMRWLRSIFRADEIAQAAAYAPQPCDVWLPVIEVMAARDEAQSGQGFYVAAKGGHNYESHNHNDIGEFVVYRNGKPLLIDAGVETYSRKTFSPQRYDIWTMQSAYHNLPTINGVMQNNGQEFNARSVSYKVDDSGAALTLDIASAYPESLGLKTWKRTVSLQRGQQVEISDSYELDAKPESLTLNLVTACEVDLDTPGKIQLSPMPLTDGRSSGSGVVSYDAATFTAAVEEIRISDARLLGTWGPRLYRIVLTATNPQQAGSWSLQLKSA